MTGRKDLTDLTLVGCGRMGLALLKGWLINGNHQTIKVIDPRPSADLLELAHVGDVHLATLEDAAAGDIVILAVKPQTFLATRWPERLLLRGGLVLSVMAGGELAQLRTAFPQAASIIRAMPNLAAVVAQSATVLVGDEKCIPWHRLYAESVFSSIGTVEWLQSEDLLAVATAVSGSGPAYAFYLAECLAQAGERAGLPPSTSARLARATLRGAGAMLAVGDVELEDLRKQVTSPNGTTEAALSVLMRADRLGSAIADAVIAATQRARELGATTTRPATSLETEGNKT